MPSYINGILCRKTLLIIEWVFLSHQLGKTITTSQELMAQLIIKGRARLRTLAGCEFSCIHLPLVTRFLEHLLQTNEYLHVALDSFPGKISAHKPSHKLFNSTFYLAPKSLSSQTPFKGLTVFTDSSGSSHRSVLTWRDPTTRE